jgi:hypothetical protein
MALEIGASVSMIYQVIGIILIFAGISVLIYFINKYMPGMGSNRGSTKILSTLFGIGLLTTILIGVTIGLGVGGSADYQEVTTGGSVYVTWTGLTLDSVYSVEIDSVTCKNFTATTTTYAHLVQIPNDGANTIILYNSSMVAQKTLYVYGTSLGSIFPDALLTALVTLVIGILILLGIAGFIVVMIKKMGFWG